MISILNQWQIHACSEYQLYSITITLVYNQWTPMIRCVYRHQKSHPKSYFFRVNLVRPHVAICTIQHYYDTWIKFLFSVQTTWRSQYDFVCQVALVACITLSHCTVCEMLFKPNDVTVRKPDPFRKSANYTISSLRHEARKKFSTSFCIFVRSVFRRHRWKAISPIGIDMLPFRGLSVCLFVFHVRA